MWEKRGVEGQNPGQEALSSSLVHNGTSETRGKEKKKIRQRDRRSGGAIL